MSKKSKKSNFRVVAEAMNSKQMEKVELPVQHINVRRLSIDEIKECIVEEFEEMKDVEDVKAKEQDWQDAEVENEVNWISSLDIKEFFKKGDK